MTRPGMEPQSPGPLADTLLISQLLAILTHIIDELRPIGLVGRMFTNGLEDLVSIPDRVTPKTLKMALDISLLNTQQYKVCISGKVEQSRERSCALPYTLVW